jgi:hypothetical protein
MILTKDKRDIAELRGALEDTSKTLDSMRTDIEAKAAEFVDSLKRQTDSHKEQARAFVDIAESLKAENAAIKDIKSDTTFNLDVIGLMLSRNLVESLHEKIGTAIGYVDQTNEVSDKRLTELSTIIGDTLSYVEKVEGIAKDTTEIEALRRAIKDTAEAVSHAKNESKQGALKLLDKQSKAAEKINTLTQTVNGLRDQLQVIAATPAQIVQVKDADISFSLQSRGQYAQDAKYKKGDIVRHAGASWLCVIDTDNEPSERAKEWALVARDGRTGGGGLSLIEYYPTLSAFPAQGVEQRFYIAQDTNTQYTFKSGVYTALGGGSSSTFETIAKNLPSANAVFTYTGGNLTQIEYAGGVIKTLAYSGGNLVTITLSGATPSGIALVKSLSYDGSGNLTQVSYS